MDEILRFNDYILSLVSRKEYEKAVRSCEVEIQKSSTVTEEIRIRHILADVFHVKKDKKLYFDELNTILSLDYENIQSCIRLAGAYKELNNVSHAIVFYTYACSLAEKRSESILYCYEQFLIFSMSINDQKLCEKCMRAMLKYEDTPCNNNFVLKDVVDYNTLNNLSNAKLFNEFYGVFKSIFQMG